MRVVNLDNQTEELACGADIEEDRSKNGEKKNQQSETPGPRRSARESRPPDRLDL